MNNEWEKLFTSILVFDSGDINFEESGKKIQALLASERADWLRSEIEKLEGEMKDEEWNEDGLSKNKKILGYNTAITSIITRYKEELKVLERKQDDWNEDMERNEELMNDFKEELEVLESK